MVCIHLLLNWALDGCEWAALHLGHSTAPERALSTYYRVGGFWADMDAVDKRNIFDPNGIRIVALRSCSHSIIVLNELHRLVFYDRR